MTSRTRCFLPFVKDPVWIMGIVPFVDPRRGVIVCFSNAVNFSDGLDGLCAGCMSIVSFAFLILALLAASRGRSLPAAAIVPTSGELAVMAGAMLGACLASCGSTVRPRRCSWATRARWRWAG
jgi:phospho-N-acetylmuramoyl-pentapeptide-transferase